MHGSQGSFVYAPSQSMTLLWPSFYVYWVIIGSGIVVWSVPSTSLNEDIKPFGLYPWQLRKNNQYDHVFFKKYRLPIVGHLIRDLTYCLLYCKCATICYCRSSTTYIITYDLNKCTPRYYNTVNAEPTNTRISGALIGTISSGIKRQYLVSIFKFAGVFRVEYHVGR